MFCNARHLLPSTGSCVAFSRSLMLKWTPFVVGVDIYGRGQRSHRRILFFLTIGWLFQSTNCLRITWSMIPFGSWTIHRQSNFSRYTRKLFLLKLLFIFLDALQEQTTQESIVKEKVLLMEWHILLFSVRRKARQGDGLCTKRLMPYSYSALCWWNCKYGMAWSATNTFKSLKALAWVQEPVCPLKCFKVFVAWHKIPYLVYFVLIWISSRSILHDNMMD